MARLFSRLSPRKVTRKIKRNVCKALTPVFCPEEILRPLVRTYCTGQGLEIGPGKSPYCDPATTLFLDKFTDTRDGTPAPDIISDANVIPKPAETFDYIVSSHVLEHMQNTIATLKEWERVLKKDGILFLVLPHGDRTFDRHREKTTLEHHISDYDKLTDEYDHSHNEEIKKGWSKNEDFDVGKEEYEREWGAPVWDFDFRLRKGAMHFHV